MPGAVDVEVQQRKFGDQLRSIVRVKAVPVAATE